MDQIKDSIKDIPVAVAKELTPADRAALDRAEKKREMRRLNRLAIEARQKERV